MNEALRVDRVGVEEARRAYFRGEFEHVLELCEVLDDSGLASLEAQLLRARAHIAVGQADRALAILRAMRIVRDTSDEALTVRMLEGAALARLSRLDSARDVLAAVQRDSEHAHSTIQAEIALHYGIVQYRRRQYDSASKSLGAVPPDADILRARASVFEGWVAFERGEPQQAFEQFHRALHEINSARHYDRFVEASALYGFAFLCSELPRVEAWPQIRRRVQRFDWSAPGVVIPQCWLALLASLITEMRGEFGEAERWASRALAVAPGRALAVNALVRLAALMGRYGEPRAHSHFVRTAQEQYDATGGVELVRDDPGLPLALAEEVVQGQNLTDAAPLLMFHREVVVPMVAGRKDAAPLDATEHVVRGILDEAAGRRSRAVTHYEQAFATFQKLGYHRRAAICAYRIVSIQGDARYRQFLARITSSLHPQYWLCRRVAEKQLDEIRLTERQIDVLRLVAAGKSNKGIAAVRGGSWYTARNVVRELISLFGVRNRSELVRVAVARGILPSSRGENAAG